jgi:hypothetical protein
MSRLQINAIRHLGSAVDNLTLDNAGRVLMPNQPSFFAGRSTLGNPSLNTTMVFNSVLHNIGNAYNSSTGVFTAPVAGVYLFSVMLLGNSASVTEAQIHVNGSSRLSGRSKESAGNNDEVNIHGVLRLAANDSVTVQLTTGAIYGNELRTDNFCGHLIG